MLVTDDQASRPDQVPADWELVWCENGCGDMVWVPPGAADLGALMVCSAICAKVMILKIQKNPS